MTPYLPPKTAAKLAEHHPEGTRHEAAKEISYSMIGNGWSETCVLQTLKDKFSDVGEKELAALVRGAALKCPSKSELVRLPSLTVPVNLTTVKSPEEQIRWWIAGVEMTVDKMMQLSPVAIPEDPAVALVLFWETLYLESEFLNIVCKFTLDEKGKANPQGSGKSMSRNDWIGYVRSKGIPRSEAGAWTRMNPCAEKGSGSDGAITDSDITQHRFLLIESDRLPIETQLAFYSKLRLPISAILSSGGKSVHCWVHIGSDGQESYKASAEKIVSLLKPFGFDTSNKNPSRLSRLPGAVREIQASADGRQALYFLNPSCPVVTDRTIAEFETSLKVPVLDDKPLRNIAIQTASRYDELYVNRGKLGLPTGLTDFDRRTGGLKAGQFIVIAAQTGGGKSTLALNWTNHALENGIGVAMFSIEIDRDELMDNLVSLRCRVNRNKFNTGEFESQDFELMTVGLPQIAKLPLWIFDDALITVEQISAAVSQLKAQHNIGLVIVDYIQLINPENPLEIREQQVARIANALRAVAKTNKVAMIVLSQLNEEGKLRESRVIAHAAHLMLMVEDLDGNKPTIRIVKGRRVEKRAYQVSFDRLYCKINPGQHVEADDAPSKGYYDRD